MLKILFNELQRNLLQGKTKRMKVLKTKVEATRWRYLMNIEKAHLKALFYMH